MQVKSVIAAAAVSTLLFSFPAASVLAGGPSPRCIPFEHKLNENLIERGPGFTCNIAAKAHVDPKGECESRLCLAIPLTNLLPGVGPLLKFEVVSICGDGPPDGLTAGPNVFDGVIDGVTSACLGAAEVGLSFPKEGKIKVNCQDGDVKTKGTFEYQCTAEE
jgi:hypothetical protein